MSKFKKLMVLILVLGCTSLTSSVWAQTSTAEWVNFYSPNSTLDGEPIPVGAVVRAYDSSGNQCGAFVVHTPGYYGFLACHFDDPNTSVDEGISPGERVHFTVNDFSAGSATVPSGVNNGDRIRVDLTALSTEDAALPTCVDGYENDDTKETANTITGPEAHTFYSHKRGWDRDWGTFTAKASHVYQIQARSSQSFDVTHPVLYLYDAKGTLLDQNDMDKWERGAELWWWNDSGKDTELYLLAEEKNGQYGCRHYTVTITSWSHAEYRARFKNH